MMSYILLIILLIIIFLLYLLTNRISLYALEYQKLEDAHSALFKAFKKRNDYLLNTYKDLETFEYIDDINSENELVEKFIKEYKYYDFDDECIKFKEEIDILLNKYNDIYLNFNQNIIKQYKLIHILCNYYEYPDYLKLSKEAM